METGHGGSRCARCESALPPATQSIRVGWPAHFGPCDWLVQALYSRSKDGATPLLKLELRAAGLGGGQGGVVPTHWTRTGQQDAAEERPAPKPSSALLGRARAAAHSEEACLLHVTDGAIKSMLRSAATDQGGLEVLSIAGAREAEGRFADALRDHTALKDLRFRDAPLVSDDAAAALVEACASTLEAADVSRTAAGPRCAQALSGCALLRRCAVDGCDLFDDDALDTLLASSALEELSCRRCPRAPAPRGS